MGYPDEIDRWIASVARYMTITKPNLTDDLAQEGRVAAWSAWNGHNMPNDIGYAKGAARRRMMQVVMEKRRMLGSENGREKIIKEEAVAVEDFPEGLDFQAEYVMLAYHHGEIYRAVQALPLRQRQAACSRMTGTPMTAEEKSAWKRAKPVLARRLAHLRELVAP